MTAANDQRFLLNRKAIVAFLTALALDLGTKWLVLHVVMIPPRAIEITPFFNLVLAFNTGISFGLFGDFFVERSILLAAAKSIIVAGLVLWALRTTNRFESLGASLIAGGAAGNIVDRALLGAVTDFLDFHWHEWHFWTFNTADVAVTLGVCCILLGALLPLTPSTQGTDANAN